MKIWRRSRCREGGQATVEFAIVVPLVIVLVLAIAQVAALAYVQLAVSHLSREIARELTVNPSADIGNLASEHSLLGQNDLRIETRIVSTGLHGRPTVVVHVAHDAVIISGAFRSFLGDVTLSAETRMAME